MKRICILAIASAISVMARDPLAQRIAHFQVEMREPNIAR